MWSFKLSAILVLQIAALVNSYPDYEIQKSVELFSSSSSDESDSSPEIYSRFSSSGESNENCGNSQRYVNCHNSKPGRRVGQQPHFIPPGQFKKGHGEHYLPPPVHKYRGNYFPSFTRNALHFPGRGPFNNRPQYNHQNHYHKHTSDFSFNGPNSNYPFYPNHNQYPEHLHTPSPYEPQFSHRPEFAHHPQFPHQSPFPHQSQFPHQPQFPQHNQFPHQPQFPRQPTFPQSPGNTENQIPGGNKGNNKCRGNSRQNCRGDDGREQSRPQIPGQQCGSRNRPCQPNVQTPQPVRPVQPSGTPPPVPATPQPTIRTTSTTPSTTTPSEEYPDIDIRFGDGDTTAKSSLTV